MVQLTLNYHVLAEIDLTDHGRDRAIVVAYVGVKTFCHSFFPLFVEIYIFAQLKFLHMLGLFKPYVITILKINWVCEYEARAEDDTTTIERGRDRRRSDMGRSKPYKHVLKITH